MAALNNHGGAPAHKMAAAERRRTHRIGSCAGGPPPSGAEQPMRTVLGAGDGAWLRSQGCLRSSHPRGPHSGHRGQPGHRGQTVDTGQPARGELPHPPQPGSCPAPLPGLGTPRVGKAPAAGREPSVPLPTSPAARGAATHRRGVSVQEAPGCGDRRTGWWARSRCPPGAGLGLTPCSPGVLRAGAAPTAPSEPAAAARPRPLPFLGRRRRRRRRRRQWPRSRNSAGRSGSGTAPTGRDGGAGSAHQQDRPQPAPLPELSGSSLMPGKLRRSARAEKPWQSLEERGSSQLGQPKLTRSRTYDPSCKDTEQAATGGQGPPSPALSKQDSSYRRAFGELAEGDALLGCFSCAWQREVPYHGRLYVSSRHVFFHSSLLLKDIKAVVPVASISALKKTNTALLVPNALSIRTAKGEKFLFVSLRQRETTYQLLRSVCKHLQDSGQSPRDSVSSEETLRKPLISSQLDPEQSTLEPNSLHDSLDEPSPRPRQAEEEEEALLAPSSSEGVPLAGTRSLWGGPHTALWAWGTALWSWMTPERSPLNIIIIIYLLLLVALLVSSGYIGLRIVELEQQLAFTVARPQLNLSQQYKTT
ncbi:GRAM domain-containing protein 2B-like [Pithys albifrons albifrons]|uniref:GRAM domain-containing protein 2B-like n=1 Tax=Pithys albifrons albifrons TaxID=3385563 RepID=UPI003A5CD192